MAARGDFPWPRLGSFNGRLRGVPDGRYQLTWWWRHRLPRGVSVVSRHEPGPGPYFRFGHRPPRP